MGGEYEDNYHNCIVDSGFLDFRLRDDCFKKRKIRRGLTVLGRGDVNALTNSWGYASYSFVAPNGNTVYVYEDRASITNEYGAVVMSFSCRTFFEVNSVDTIVNWRWEGNDCSGPTMKMWGRPNVEQKK